MTKVHGAHRQRQQVVPPRMTAIERERERKIAAAMWAHESDDLKDQRLIEATRESKSWISPQNRKDKN